MSEAETPAARAAIAEGNAEASSEAELPVDWRALEWAADHGAADEPAFLDTRTGELVYLAVESAAGVAGGGSLVQLPMLTGGEEIEWMQRFVERLDDDWPRDALIDALLLAEAPRRAFEQALGRFPAERMRWLGYRRERLRRRIEAWLQENGIRSAPPDGGGGGRHS